MSCPPSLLFQWDSHEVSTHSFYRFSLCISHIQSGLSATWASVDCLNSWMNNPNDDLYCYSKKSLPLNKNRPNRPHGPKMTCTQQQQIRKKKPGQGWFLPGFTARSPHGRLPLPTSEERIQSPRWLREKPPD